MTWINESPGAPAGLAEWARAYPSSLEARAACQRVDWLFWLLSAAADSERLQRSVVNSGVWAIETSPALRGRALRVAAAHIWSAPIPQDRPTRSSRLPLLLAAAVATVICALLDFAIMARLAVLQRPSSGAWIRSAVGLAVWCLLLVILQRQLETRAERVLEADARSMTFERARIIVAGELGRSPTDAHALKDLRESDARLFRSTPT